MTEGDYNGNELLLFQLGPVQEFIAQAETVGDLWAGSYLLTFPQILCGRRWSEKRYLPSPIGSWHGCLQGRVRTPRKM